MIYIPLKLGNEDYLTLGKKSIRNIRNEEVAQCSLSPPMMVELSKFQSREDSDLYKKMDIQKIIELFDRAGEIFKGNVRFGDKDISFDEYMKIIVETTGLPIKYVKEGQAVIYYYLKNIGSILKSQSPDGSLEIYNNNIFSKGNKEIGWVRDGVDVGVISPSNNPTVHTIWMTALAMKSQLFIKPSLDEVFTPLRIIESLYMAGMEKKQVYFLPGEHELTNKILEMTSKGICFGAHDTIKRYKKLNPYIKYYGPGRSKLFIDKAHSQDFDKIAKHASDGIMSYGGKGCISLSGIIASDGGQKIAERIAEELSKIKIYDPLEKNAEIPAITQTDLFWGLQNFIHSMVDMGAENISEKYCGDEIGVTLNGLNYLRPTVLYMDKTHPFFGMELPFPFVTVTDADKNGAKELLRNSLSVSVITEDNAFYRELLLDGSIQILHRGYPQNVYDVDPEKPFEGYLSDYLYKYIAI